MKGKVILITGATFGIGRATALLFAKEGAKVAACGRSEKEGTALLGEIETLGGEGFFQTVDVRHASDVEAFVANTVKRSK